MSRGLFIEIDDAELSRMAREFGSTDAQFTAAMRSAYGKMGRWLLTQSVRGLSPLLGIQQKILRRRVKTFRMQGGVSSNGFGAKVWYGLNPIPFRDLPYKKTAKGVRAAGQEVEGAFIAKRYGREDVMRRTTNKRYPIESVTLDIHDKAITHIEDYVVGTDEFERQFFKFLEHELSWRTR